MHRYSIVSISHHRKYGSQALSFGSDSKLWGARVNPTLLMKSIWKKNLQYNLSIMALRLFYALKSIIKHFKLKKKCFLRRTLFGFFAHLLKPSQSRALIFLMNNPCILFIILIFRVWKKYEPMKMLKGNQQTKDKSTFLLLIFHSVVNGGRIQIRHEYAWFRLEWNGIIRPQGEW